MPSVSQLGGFNRFVLAFDMTVGAVDDAVLWTQLDQNTRTSILNSYHAAGKAIMVSAFGSTGTREPCPTLTDRRPHFWWPGPRQPRQHDCQLCSPVAA